jgi:hypothetical protein
MIMRGKRCFALILFSCPAIIPDGMAALTRKDEKDCVYFTARPIAI